MAALSFVEADGRTSCCGAFTSIAIDDGAEYCKGCYQAVVNEGPRVEVALPPVFGDPDWNELEEEQRLERQRRREAEEGRER